MTCEREKLAADRRTAKTLIGIADEINSLRCLVDVAEMASETLDADYGAPLCALLSLVSDRLRAVAQIVLQPNTEGSANVA